MRYVIAVGANLGEAMVVVSNALDSLADRLDGDLVARSSLYRTAPVGGPEQPDFINAVTIIDSDLQPSEILTRLQAVENESGRVRDIRWGPRTLDLDVIVAGEVVSDDPNLTIPHARAHERAFVLLPWLEIDPLAEIPGIGAVRAIVESGFKDQDVAVVGS